MDNKNLNKIGSITLALIGLVSSMITIVNGYSETIATLSKYLGFIISHILVYFNFFILLPFAIFLVITAIISYGTKKYRTKIGTHEIPCTLMTMIHFKVANKNNKLLNSIHRDIYHHYYKIKDDICSHRIGSVENANKAIEEFLRVIHSSILKTFRMDLTINIKRLSLDRQENLCLIPFIHYRNVAERSLHNPRDFNYCYYIGIAEFEKLSRYATMARAYRDREKYEVNSIFTYLINQRKRYWMSNDLQIDQMNGIFFTSSDNYPEYYKSLAVFSIAPPDKDVLPEGLLIFDTKKTGKFSETECAQLFGYIAHLLYELLTEYNKYESKKKQKSR